MAIGRGPCGVVGDFLPDRVSRPVEYALEIVGEHGRLDLVELRRQVRQIKRRERPLAAGSVPALRAENEPAQNAARAVGARFERRFDRGMTERIKDAVGIRLELVEPWDEKMPVSRLP